MKKLLILILASVLAVSAFSGCSSSASTTPPAVGTAYTTETVGTFSASDPVAVITMKDGGVITLELRPDQAPNTVANFIYLANNGFYDGLIFHRIMKGFMIQSGDPTGTGGGGPGYSIAGEFFNNNFTTNTLSHVMGTISMARQGDATSGMDTAGSQFFICDADSSFLDQQYAAFGSVLSGIDDVHKIADLPVTDDNGTVQRNSSGGISATGTIAFIRVDTKGKDYGKPTVNGTLPY